MYKHPLIDRDKMEPSEALKILKEGNHRFINNLRMNNDYPALLENTKNQQHPFAWQVDWVDPTIPQSTLSGSAMEEQVGSATSATLVAVAVATISVVARSKVDFIFVDLGKKERLVTIITTDKTDQNKNQWKPLDFKKI